MLARGSIRNVIRPRPLTTLFSSSTPSSAATHVEVIVIGAGVIGLAVARACAKAEREVLLLERANTIGSGTKTYAHV
jgi:NADPH-dependent 2,4-dienoyl-CoA reductase/sulfur reductase-like enzyme